MSGSNFNPKSANFDTLYLFFPIFTPKFANANLDNFYPKKCNFGKFSTSESGEIFSQFFRLPGKKIFFFWQNINLFYSELETWFIFILL